MDLDLSNKLNYQFADGTVKSSPSQESRGQILRVGLLNDNNSSGVIDFYKLTHCSLRVLEKETVCRQLNKVLKENKPKCNSVTIVGDLKCHNFLFISIGRTKVSFRYT